MTQEGEVASLALSAHKHLESSLIDFLQFIIMNMSNVDLDRTLAMGH